jgi:hypothetical protein
MQILSAGATGTIAPPSPRTRARGAGGARGAGAPPPAAREPRPGGECVLCSMGLYFYEL